MKLLFKLRKIIPDSVWLEIPGPVSSDGTLCIKAKFYVKGGPYSVQQVLNEDQWTNESVEYFGKMITKSYSSMGGYESSDIYHEGGIR